MTLDPIIAVVCEALKVSAEEVRGRGRHPRVVLARAMIYHAARRRTWASYPSIARETGRPGHSSVIEARKRLDKIAGTLLHDHLHPWDLLPDWTPTMTVADLGAFIDEKMRAAGIQDHGQEPGTKIGESPRKAPVDIQTQRKLAKVKAETPFSGSAKASEAVQPVVANPQAPARPEPSTASRCPACGLRTLAQTHTIDAKGRTLWRCTRTGVCRWEAWGRA